MGRGPEPFSYKDYFFNHYFYLIKIQKQIRLSKMNSEEQPSVFKNVQDVENSIFHEQKNPEDSLQNSQGETHETSSGYSKKRYASNSQTHNPSNSNMKRMGRQKSSGVQHQSPKDNKNGDNNVQEFNQTNSQQIIQRSKEAKSESSGISLIPVNEHGNGSKSSGKNDVTTKSSSSYSPSSDRKQQKHHQKPLLKDSEPVSFVDLEADLLDKLKSITNNQSVSFFSFNLLMSVYIYKILNFFIFRFGYLDIINDTRT